MAVAFELITETVQTEAESKRKTCLTEYQDIIKYIHFFLRGTAVKCDNS